MRRAPTSAQSATTSAKGYQGLRQRAIRRRDTRASPNVSPPRALLAPAWCQRPSGYPTTAPPEQSCFAWPARERLPLCSKLGDDLRAALASNPVQRMDSERLERSSRTSEQIASVRIRIWRRSCIDQESCHRGGRASAALGVFTPSRPEGARSHGCFCDTVQPLTRGCSRGFRATVPPSLSRPRSSW